MIWNTNDTLKKSDGNFIQKTIRAEKHSVGILDHLSCLCGDELPRGEGGDQWGADFLAEDVGLRECSRVYSVGADGAYDAVLHPIGSIGVLHQKAGACSGLYGTDEGALG